MIYTPLTRKAMLLCYEAHKEQYDKAGVPYVFHLLHVAEQMTDEFSCVTALLHDVIEDSSCTLEDLREMQYPEAVLEALRLLTHQKGTPYMEYIRQLKPNPIARQVKLADLQHNSDISRLDHPSDADLKRAQKYQKAIHLLTV